MSGSVDTTVKVWHNGAVLHSLRGHSKDSSLAALPNGDIASASESERKICVWRHTRRVQTMECASDVYSLIVLPSGQLVSGCENGSIVFWE